MGASSSIMKPQELVEFRKLNTSIENVDIPARPESRVLTDKKGFIIFGIALLIFLPLFIYTLVKSDIRHLEHGTDMCGNFCGVNNTKIDGIACSGKNYQHKPYESGTTCVYTCPSDFVPRGGVCELKTRERRQIFNEDDFDINLTSEDGPTETQLQDGLTQSGKEGWKYLVAIVITIALAILTLVMLRYLPGPLIWAIIIFSMLILVVITVGIWYGYTQVKEEDKTGILVVGIIWTAITLIILLVFFVLFKKIGLVVQLYKETTKVLASMPMLVFVPIWTAILQVIIFIICVTSTFFMTQSRDLQEIVKDERYTYQMTVVMIVAICLNIVFTIWVMRFIHGIQFLTISGSVSIWYFSRNKQYLGMPICRSFGTTMKYHLGTLLFGSFILTLFSVVKVIIRAVISNDFCKCLYDFCCNNMEMILKFLSENAYIETGIHGQSYLRSAKRATKLLLTNAKSMIAINCVGDFVLGMIVLVVTLIATGISYALFMNLGVGATIPTVICFFLNLIIVCITFGTFQTIIDTLFICFCEDTVINDGMSKPYYMSKGLMEFVENSKKIYKGK